VLAGDVHPNTYLTACTQWSRMHKLATFQNLERCGSGTLVESDIVRFSIFGGDRFHGTLDDADDKVLLRNRAAQAPVQVFGFSRAAQ